MVEYETGDCWQLVVMPDGYRVWANAYYDQFKDASSLFGMNVDGVGENGERVTVQGTHIARANRSRVRPKAVPR